MVAVRRVVFRRKKVRPEAPYRRPPLQQLHRVRVRSDPIYIQTSVPVEIEVTIFAESFPKHGGQQSLRNICWFPGRGIGGIIRTRWLRRTTARRPGRRGGGGRGGGGPPPRLATFYRLGNCCSSLNPSPHHAHNSSAGQNTQENIHTDFMPLSARPLVVIPMIFPSLALQDSSLLKTIPPFRLYPLDTVMRGKHTKLSGCPPYILYSLSSCDNNRAGGADDRRLRPPEEDVCSPRRRRVVVRPSPQRLRRPLDRS